MEASVFKAPTVLSGSRLSIGLPPLRLRSDEQLVALFRRGHDEAFRVIHDRYHKRLLAYARQMLPRTQDAEDALQDVFVRAYFGLRANNRDLALRAWLFRVAHNRCIDELRRPAPPPPEILEMLRTTVHDPVAEVENRESLRRLVADVRRLPEQQRSALLMRELDGMAYEDLAASLGVTVPAVKSLLVRARVGLAQSAEARDTACTEIRAQLASAHDQGVRPNALARRHMRDCAGCRGFRGELRGVSRELAALAPTLGPLAFLLKLWAGATGARHLTEATASGSGTSGGATTVGGAVGAGGSSAGMAVGVNHLAALLAAAAATGGAVELQTSFAPSRPPSSQASVRAAPTAGGSASPPQIVIPLSTGRAATAASGQAAGPAMASSGGGGNAQPSTAPATSAPASASPSAPAPATRAQQTRKSTVAPQTLDLPGPPSSVPTSTSSSNNGPGVGLPGVSGSSGGSSTGGSSGSGTYTSSTGTSSSGSGSSNGGTTGSGSTGSSGSGGSGARDSSTETTTTSGTSAS